MKFFLILIVLSHFPNFFVPSQAQSYTQFVTRDSAVIDTFFHSYIIEDKYRWLENINSDESKEWLEKEDKAARKYLKRAQSGSNIAKMIRTYGSVDYLWQFKSGDYYFEYARDIKGNAMLCYQKSPEGQTMKLIDPKRISKKDRIEINDFSLSADSKWLAYQFSRNGSDWSELNVISMPDGKPLNDHLTGLKFSDIAWLNDGFFYSTVNQDGYFGETHGEKVWYHKIGHEQQEDKLIFQRKNKPSALFGFMTTSDEQYFVLSENNPLTAITNIYYIDYQSETPALVPLITNLKDDINIIANHDGKFIGITSRKSENFSIVEMDPANPYKWHAIAPAFSKAILLDVYPFSDRMVAVYQANQRPIITIYDYSGAILYTMELPLATSVDGFEGKFTDEDQLFKFSSYTFPPTVYKFNIKPTPKSQKYKLAAICDILLHSTPPPTPPQKGRGVVC